MECLQLARVTAYKMVCKEGEENLAEKGEGPRLRRKKEWECKRQGGVCRDRCAVVRVIAKSKRNSSHDQLKDGRSEGGNAGSCQRGKEIRRSSGVGRDLRVPFGDGSTTPKDNRGKERKCLGGTRKERRMTIKEKGGGMVKSLSPLARIANGEERSMYHQEGQKLAPKKGGTKVLGKD